MSSSDLEREIAHLQRALSTRRTVGIAVGIIMERFGLAEDRAFEYLVRLSQHSNTKLVEIADELRTTGRVPRPEPTPDQAPGEEPTGTEGA